MSKIYLFTSEGTWKDDKAGSNSIWETDLYSLSGKTCWNRLARLEKGQVNVLRGTKTVTIVFLYSFASEPEICVPGRHKSTS